VAADRPRLFASFRATIVERSFLFLTESVINPLTTVTNDISRYGAPDNRPFYNATPPRRWIVTEKHGVFRPKLA